MMLWNTLNHVESGQRWIDITGTRIRVCTGHKYACQWVHYWAAPQTSGSHTLSPRHTSGAVERTDTSAPKSMPKPFINISCCLMSNNTTPPGSFLVSMRRFDVKHIKHDLHLGAHRRSTDTMSCNLSKADASSRQGNVKGFSPVTSGYDHLVSSAFQRRGQSERELPNKLTALFCQARPQLLSRECPSS